jgi:hypothetical protein
MESQTVAIVTAPLYTVVLLAHVISGLLGFGVVMATGIQANGLRRAVPGTVPDRLVRFFRPGTNWAAFILFLVPVFGIALLVLSRGHFRADAPWVLAGIACWTIAALAAIRGVWPAERRLQALVGAAVAPSGGPVDVRSPEVVAEVELLGRRAARASAISDVCYVVAFALMFAKP